MDLEQLLGDEADSLLNHTATAFPAELLTCPAPTTSTRSSSTPTGPPTVLRNLGTLYNTGRLAGTGYLSILPVDQGIEHSAAASFAKNPGLLRPGQARATWPSPATATPSPPRSAASASCPAATCTGSPSS